MAVKYSAAALDRLTERACSVQTQRTRPNGTRGAEDAHSAEMAETGRLRVRKVSTHDIPADLMTKAMSREKLIKFGRALNLRGSLFTDLSRPAKQQQ